MRAMHLVAAICVFALFAALESHAATASLAICVTEYFHCMANINKGSDMIVMVTYRCSC